jgi:hypothetical protein
MRDVICDKDDWGGAKDAARWTQLVPSVEFSSLSFRDGAPTRLETSQTTKCGRRVTCGPSRPKWTEGGFGSDSERGFGSAKRLVEVHARVDLDRNSWVAMPDDSLGLDEVQS